MSLLNVESNVLLLFHLVVFCIHVCVDVIENIHIYIYKNPLENEKQSYFLKVIVVSKTNVFSSIMTKMLS